LGAVTINTRLIDHLPRRARAALRLLDAGTTPNAMLLRDFTRRERAALNALAAGATPSAALYADLPRDVRAALRGVTPISAGAPASEIVFADFITETYRLNGETAAIGDLFAQNTDWGSWNAVSNLDQWTEPGMDGQPVVQPAIAADLIENGFTVVATIAGTPSFSVDVAELPNYSAEVFAITAVINSRLVEYVGGFLSNHNIMDLSAGEHVIRISFVAGDRLSVSVDGSTDIETIPVASIASAFNNLNLNLGNNSSAVTKRIAIYSPAVSDAALPSYNGPT
jgi:hypothetical protein